MIAYQAGTVLQALWTTMRWEAQQRRMYDRVVDVPRLVATWPDDGPGHPLLPALAAAVVAIVALGGRRRFLLRPATSW